MSRNHPEPEKMVLRINDEGQRVKIDVAGPCDVRGQDIHPWGGVDIINPGGGGGNYFATFEQ